MLSALMIFGEQRQSWTRTTKQSLRPRGIEFGENEQKENKTCCKLRNYERVTKLDYIVEGAASGRLLSIWRCMKPETKQKQTMILNEANHEESDTSTKQSLTLDGTDHEILKHFEARFKKS